MTIGYTGIKNMNQIGNADKVFYYTIGVISGMIIEFGIVIFVSSIH